MPPTSSSSATKTSLQAKSLWSLAMQDRSASSMRTKLSKRFLKKLKKRNKVRNKKTSVMEVFLFHYIWANIRLRTYGLRPPDFLNLLAIERHVEDHSDKDQDDEYRYPTP